jgi:hypothetical protein
MISDSSLGHENAFPGRLKIIALAPDLTVVYAGHSDPALYAIRQLHSRRITKLDELLAYLKDCTASPDHEVEFLVLSHQNEADLRRVWSGQISNSLEDAALGESAIRSSVYSRLPVTDDEAKGAKGFYQAFIGAFTDPRVNRGPGVGGFPVGLCAAPEGHIYHFHSFHQSWKPIEFLPGVEQHQDPADMQSGDWTFHHSVISPRLAGIPVLAAQVQQARRAYIYSPLFDDDPKVVVLLELDVDWTKHQDEMNRRTTDALDEAVNRASALMAT